MVLPVSPMTSTFPGTGSATLPSGDVDLASTRIMGAFTKKGLIEPETPNHIPTSTGDRECPQETGPFSASPL
jgi:hypothetical protein